MGILSYFKFGKIKNGEHILVVGIGSHYIKTVILNIDSAGKQFEVVDLNKERREIQFAENLTDDLSINIKKSVLGILRKNESSTPKKILFVLENNIIKSDLSGFEFVRQDPQAKIAMAEIREFLRLTINRLKEEFGEGKDVLKIISGEIQNIAIDGYSVENPLGFQGKKIKLDIFCSFLREDIFDLLDSLAKDLNMNFLGIFGRNWLMSEYLLISQKQGNALFIDIGDATTDLILIKDGSIRAIKSFDFGGSNLTQSVAAKMEVGAEEAENLKLGYLRKEFKKEVLEKMAVIIKVGFGDWAKKLGVPMRDLLKADMLPEKVYVGGEGILMISEIANIFNDQNSIIAKDISMTSATVCELMEIIKDNNFIGAPKSSSYAIDTPLFAAGFVQLGIFNKNGLNALLKDFLK